MRPLESVLFLGLLACVLMPWPRARAWAVLGTVAAAVLNLGLEGERWQMAPLYLLAGLAGAATLLGLRSRPPTGRRAEPGSAGTPASSHKPGASRRLPAASRFLLVPVLALTALPPILFPVPRLPDPGGPFAIGTLTFDWTDPARPDTFAPVPGGPRRLVVQVWYPAVPAPGAGTGPWMERLDRAGPIMARYLGLPGFFLDHLALTATHAFPGAPAAAGEAPFPVVIYSHGWNGFRTVNVNQSEALASRGYVAVAVDHTYGAMVTVFPDGQVALNNPALLPDDAPDPEYQQASERLEAGYALDLSFVLDMLARVNAGEIPGPLTGRLDLERVGIYGHSTGGGAAVIACSQDARCRAGLGLDAWLEPVPLTFIQAGPPQPFLFMRSEVWATPENDRLLDDLYRAAPGDLYRLTIRGTRHYDFTLLPLLTPLAPALGLKGPLDGQRAVAVVTDYLVAFFDQYLKGQPSALLAGPSADYPEVAFERR